MAEIAQRIVLDQKIKHSRRTRGETASAVLALFVLYGFLTAAKDLMYGSAALYGSALAGTLIVAVLAVSVRLPKRKRLIRIGLAIVCAVLAVLFFLFIMRGLLDTANRLLSLLNLKFETEFSAFSVSGNLYLASAAFWTALSGAAGAVFFWLVRGRRPGWTAAVLIAELLFAFIVGRSAMWDCALWFLLGLSTDFSYALTPRRRLGPRFVAVTVLGLLLCLAAAVALGGYAGSAQVARLKQNLLTQYEKIRYGEDTLPQGDLTEAGGLLDGDSETLEVTMEEPRQLYLRGYVGSEYTGTAWETLSGEAYADENEGLIEWLTEQNAAPTTQYAAYDRLDKETLGTQTAYDTVKVENTGAYRKYVYLPYDAVSWSAGASEAKKDWQVLSLKFLGASSYTFREVKDAPTADGVTVSSWVQEPETDAQKTYADAESVYHYFVQEQYLDMDSETRELINETFFEEEMEDPEDFNEVTARIRSVLRSQTTYTEYPAYTADDGDFLTYFLKEKKEGNAVYYASAAVMAYRAAGFPARYVEGYRYGQEEADALDSDAEATVTLTSQNAHAWVEVYVSGAGWMPVEVVPGMYVETYTDQVIEGRPSYQVNSKQEEDGLSTDDDASQDVASTKKTTAADRTDWLLPILLLVLYALFFLYLLLELQRAVRIRRRGHRRDALAGIDLAGLFLQEMQALLLCAGIRGDFTRPLDLTDQVTAALSGITAERYARAIGLIQKVGFGGKELKPHEEHALWCFMNKLRAELYESRGFFGRLRLRYRYAVETPKAEVL